METSDSVQTALPNATPSGAWQGRSSIYIYKNTKILLPHPNHIVPKYTIPTWHE